jgi:hypothetical protein
MQRRKTRVFCSPDNALLKPPEIRVNTPYMRRSHKRRYPGLNATGRRTARIRIQLRKAGWRQILYFDALRLVLGFRRFSVSGKPSGCQ